MKFLMIASYAGSVVSFRGHLIESLIGEGYDVHVAAPGLTKDSTNYGRVLSLGAVPVDIPLHRTGTNPLRDVVLLWRLCGLMGRLRPNAVLAYTVKPVIYGSIAGWIMQVPHRYALITGLGYTFTGTRTGLTVRIARWLYRTALARTEKVFFQNPDDQKMFRDARIVPDNVPSVVVNGSGVDTEWFSVCDVPTRPVRFLMIARLLGDKGVREYAAAAARVRAVHKSAVFQLVGWIDDGPDAISRSELDEWMEQGAVEYLGRLEDVRQAIAGCTVYVLPSYREGTPRTVLEAMAMGRAIITTDVPGCRETVIDGENGILVASHSMESLADAMSMYAEHPELAVKHGMRSRKIAEDKYDVRKVTSVMIDEMSMQRGSGA